MKVGRALPSAWVLVAAATTVAIVVAAARGMANGYEPVSDIAVVELRGREVLTRDNPLIGMWSSGSLRAGIDFNHPGPMQFWFYAVPVRLFGAGAGLAVGAAALNVAAVWTIALTGRRVGGGWTALVAASATAVLVWNMGSEVLYDAWPPNAVVLTFLAMVMLVWATLLGHLWAFVPAVVAGSLALQSHLSYLLLVPGLLLTGAVGGIVATRRSGDTVPWQPFGAAAAGGLALWMLPLWEQLFGSGSGNLGRLLESSAGGEGERLGFALGARLVGSVVALPPAWVPPGYDTAVPTQPLVVEGADTSLPTADVPGLLTVLISVAVLAALFGWCAWDARRRNERSTTGALVVVGVALVLAYLTVAIVPVDNLGLTPHKLRFLWPVAAFIWIVVVSHVRVLWRDEAWAVWPPRVLAAAAVGVAVLTLPAATPTTGPVALRDAWPAVRELRAQMGALDGVGTVLFDPGGLYYLEPYTWPLMAELERRQIPFVLESSSSQRQVGDSHRYRGDADVRVFVRVGDDARTTPVGATRVAFVDDPVTGPAAVFSVPVDAS